MCAPVLETIVSAPVLASAFLAGAAFTLGGLWLFFRLIGRAGGEGEG
ncbi:hypothetical protein [Xanthobacter sp.]|nr:hypothetical protein [Xanthobacter sp.]